MLSEGTTDDINGSVCSAEKKVSTSFGKARTIFCLSLHHNGDKSYFCVNGKKIYNLKVDNKNIKFPVQFCSGNISEKFNALESREVSFKGNLCDFSVDYNAIDKSDILNIHKYLMVKNDIK